MNKKFTAICAFIVGAATGAIAAWKYAERIHNKIFEAELEANVELEVERRLRGNPADKEPRRCTEKPDIKKYASQISNYGYTGYGNYQAKKTDIPEQKPESVLKLDDDTSIVLISPEEMGINEMYNIRDLSYYEGDGVITDEDDEVIDMPQALIGSDALNHFGDYAENSVFVCNNQAQCYYEVTRLKNLKFYPSED